MANISNNTRTAIIEGIIDNVTFDLSYNEVGIVHEDNEIYLDCSLNFSSGDQKYYFSNEDGEEEELTEDEKHMIYEALLIAGTDHRKEYDNSEYEDIQSDNFYMTINQY